MLTSVLGRDFILYTSMQYLLYDHLLTKSFVVKRGCIAVPSTLRWVLIQLAYLGYGIRYSMKVYNGSCSTSLNQYTIILKVV